MSYIECPYCGFNQYIGTEDYPDENEIGEIECQDCEKSFAVTMEITYHFETHTADCMNGGAHRYEKTHTFPSEFARLRCPDCGDEKPLPEVEKCQK